MSHKKHEASIGSVLPAIAYGDAMGLPYEAKKPQPEQSVTGLSEIKNTFIGEYPIGTWSDDTHLSLAVAKSLIDANGFDLSSQAAWHVAAFEHTLGATYEPDLISAVVSTATTNGWGRSTTLSVKRLQKGVPAHLSGQPEGASNGVLMKMAPLVLWQLSRGVEQTEAESQIIALTRMTHQSSEAIVSSLVHRRYLERMWHNERNPVNLLEASAIDAREYEERFQGKYITSKILGALACKRENLPREYILEQTPKKGFYAPETLAMVYGSLVREKRVPLSVMRSVELGGDSDSVGSIVASISNLTSPGFAESQTDYSRLFDVSRLEQISQQLAAAALRTEVSTRTD